jgi:hypothetical protein
LNSLGDEVCYRTPDGAVRYRRRVRSEEDEATALALSIKKMQRVVEVFIEACKVDLLMAWVAAKLYQQNSNAIPG